MLNIADTLHRWCDEASPFALATIVNISGSAPLPLGTALAVHTDGTVVGSISGGCIEAAVYELCQRVLEHGEPASRASFGYSDDDAFAVGLTCGGQIDVLVQRVDPLAEPQLIAALNAVTAGRAVAVAHVVDGPGELVGRTFCVPDEGAYDGTLGDAHEDRAIVAHARALLRAGRTGRFKLGAESASASSESLARATYTSHSDEAEAGGGAETMGEATCSRKIHILVHVHASRPRMLIFGAIDFATALSQAGSFLGYRVTVCDARPIFATAARFPHADEVITDWPHRYLAATEVDARTAICVLTHDPKFDIPLLRLALTLPVGYVGAMGSRHTHERRLGLLRELGITEDQLACLHSPIGLDLGARTPEETAVSITAEIIAWVNDGTGLPLAQGTGPIHRMTDTGGRRTRLRLDANTGRRVKADPDAESTGPGHRVSIGFDGETPKRSAQTVAPSTPVTR